MSIKKPLVFLNLLAIIIILIPSFAYSGGITVRHGNFEHFNISMPEQIIAGADTQIKLSAADSLNNAVLNVGETKRNFVVSVTGSATVKPQAFELSSFVDGTFAITLTDKTAETVILSLTEMDNPTSVLTREFTVTPDKLSSLYVKGPRTVIAGEKFEVRITEKDSFGNTVADPLFGRNLSVSFNGNTEPRLDMSSITDFKNGTGIIGFIAEKTGNVAIEVKDVATGSSGASERINIKNGDLHSFKLISLRELIAGEAFELSIFPVDQFGNVIPSYSSTGKGVVITSSGKQKPFPSTVPAAEFVNGQAKVELRYDSAETVKIKVAELDGKQVGESVDIVFLPSTLERLEVITPDSVIAGQKFKIKISAYNQFSHIIRNYNLTGTDVLLSTTGTGNLTPNRIPPAEFINGVAIIDAQYNKAESFDISAAAEKPKEPASEVRAAVTAIKNKKRR